MVAQNLVRFQTVPDISYILRFFFQIISRRKVKKMHRVQSLKAEEHFNAKNRVLKEKITEIERGQNCI